MGLFIWSVVGTCTLVLTLFNTVTALRCYQCKSSETQSCGEKFYDENGYNPLSAEYCDLYEAKYCIKATGIWGGTAGTRRFCSAKDVGNQCQYIQYPDHDRIYQACVYSCTGDDCNGSPVLPHLSLPLLLLVAIIVYIIR